MLKSLITIKYLLLYMPNYSIWNLHWNHCFKLRDLRCLLRFKFCEYRGYPSHCRTLPLRCISSCLLCCPFPQLFPVEPTDIQHYRFSHASWARSERENNNHNYEHLVSTYCVKYFVKHLTYMMYINLVYSLMDSCMPWPEIEPATLACQVDALTNWATWTGHQFNSYFYNVHCIEGQIETEKLSSLLKVIQYGKIGILMQMVQSQSP